MLGGEFWMHPWYVFAAPVVVEDPSFPAMRAFHVATPDALRRDVRAADGDVLARQSERAAAHGREPSAAARTAGAVQVAGARVGAGRRGAQSGGLGRLHAGHGTPGRGGRPRGGPRRAMGVQGENGIPGMRPDHDFAIAWAKSYGKGRVFYRASATRAPPGRIPTCGRCISRRSSGRFATRTAARKRIRSGIRNLGHRAVGHRLSAIDHRSNVKTAADLGVPERFNAAAHFVDRHLAEGRGGNVAIECGDDARHLRRAGRARQPLRQRAARRARRRPEERVLLLLLDGPRVRLHLLRRDQDRRGADSAQHAVEAGRLPAT